MNRKWWVGYGKRIWICQPKEKGGFALSETLHFITMPEPDHEKIGA